MAISALAAIIIAVVASTTLSYVMTQKAQKKAKKAADDMAGLLINKESNVEPLRVIYGVRRVGGVRVFVSTRDSNGGDPNEFLYICLVLCEGEVHSITDIHLDDIPITDSKYSGLVTTSVHTGADNQAYDSLLTQANAGWTSAHRLRGVAYVAVKLKWDADVFSGVPEITALVSGRKVYDPRKDSTSSGYDSSLGVSNQRFATPSTWTFSLNASLCIRDYLSNARFGKGLSGNKLDDVAFGSAATFCDSTVQFYSGGAYGKIFDINAVLQTDDTLFENVQIMLMGCRGFLPYNQGVYSLRIDRASSSVYAFTVDNIIGGISISGESKENKFNRVNVKFVNPTLDYQPDTATWPDAGSSEETAFLAEDNGTLLVSDMELPTCTNFYVARDLARVILRRSRNALRCSIRTTSEGLQLSVGDVVTVNHPTPAWGDKPFQVEEITLNYDGTCSLALLEYDQSIYTYDTSAEEKTYPDTNLPNPFAVGTPGSLSTSAATSVALDGTIIPQINMSWAASTDSFVTQYDVQYSTDNSTFTSVITDGLTFVITPVVPGATYYTRVRSINALGVKSAFVTSNQGSTGDTTAPAIPTSLSATAGYKSISLKWTNPSDKDFSNVEVYRATSSGGTYVEVATVGGGYSAATEFLNGGLADATAFYYKFKAVDYSANKSAFSGIVNATTNAAAINGTNGTNGSNGSNGTDGTDGSNGSNGSNGAAGPRSTAGYLYYSLSAGSAPSTPSASSYNFSNGAFSGLTSNWSKTPPNVTGGDAHYWAVSYLITEATLNGSQTLTFSSPFSSLQFDGLVTFSNLNSELADASGEITTINGGLVKTGTLNVALVNISGTTQSGFNMQSAASGSRIKILHDKIEIYDGSLSAPRIKLGNLS